MGNKEWDKLAKLSLLDEFDCEHCIFSTTSFYKIGDIKCTYPDGEHRDPNIIQKCDKFEWEGSHRAEDLLKGE